MTLLLKSTPYISWNSSTPTRGEIFIKWEDHDELCDKIDLSLAGDELEYEKEKKNWELDDEDDPDGGYCGKIYEEWKKSKYKKWKSIYGKMCLDGTFDKKKKEFPLNHLIPHEGSNKYVRIVGGNTIWGYEETNCWIENGIDEDDYILAEESGLLTPRTVKGDQLYDYMKMVDQEEEFLNDGDDFIKENDMIYEGAVRNCESLEYKDGCREYVEVRIESIGDNFAIGSIDGKRCVYIPISVIEESENPVKTCSIIKERSNKSDCKRKIIVDDDIKSYEYGKKIVGEICLMDIYHKKTEKNEWRATNIHPKFQYPKAIYTDNSINYIRDVVCLDQNIGRLVGKNGKNMNQVKNSIMKICPEIKPYWQKFDMEHYENTRESDKYIEGGDAPNISFKKSGEYLRAMIFDKFLIIDGDMSENVNADDISFKKFCGFDSLPGILRRISY